MSRIVTVGLKGTFSLLAVLVIGAILLALPSSAQTITLSLSASSGAESSDVTVTATLDQAPAGDDLTFNIVDNSGTATVGADETTLPQAVTFLDGTGVLSQDFVIDINDDVLDEADETLIFSVSGITCASCSNGPFAQGGTDQTYTITDNDPTPTVTLEASKSSGEGTATVNVSVTLSAVSGQDVTVPFTIGAGSTATGGGTDYSFVASPLVISAGALSANIVVTVVEDALDEADETVIIDMTTGSLVNATAGATTQHTLTITDNDPTPTVSLEASKSSGEGTATVNVSVTLSAVSGQDVTVPFTIGAGSTATGGGTDYSFVASPLVISAGALSANIVVTVVEDALDEADETVIIDMTTGSLVNATAGATTQHTLTITDNDPTPTVTLEASKSSGEGTATVNVSVTLSAVSGQDVTVPFTIGAGSTATGGGTDYSFVASPLVISAGALSANIVVTVVDDALSEADETVIIDMTTGSLVNATAGATTQHTYTITDDDTDYGDAPDTGAGTGVGNYNTLLSDSGARHQLGGAFLGAVAPDFDSGTLQNADSDADEADNTADEDALTNPVIVAAGTTPTYSVYVDLNGETTAYLEAWIDTDKDGEFEAAEHVYSGTPQAVTASGMVSFTIPTAMAALDVTYMRIRVHGSVTTVGPTGLALKGEVEDYRVEVYDVDYGDAPDPNYPTLAANNGPRHYLIANQVILGAAVDGDADGQPSADSGANGTTGDDGDGTDDEDGVTLASAYQLGTTSSVPIAVTFPAGGPWTAYLNAWVDFDGDGSFADAGEQLITDLAVAGSGTTTVQNMSLTVPAGAALGSTSARFRVSMTSAATGGYTFVGLAPDGEVEDYQVTFVSPDFGDAPTNAQSGFAGSYPTLLANSAAYHAIVAGAPTLGATVDAETDGQPAADAGLAAGSGDDNTAGSDDEDGVTLAASYVAGASATVPITVTFADAGIAYLNAWFDWNADGDWDDANERMLTDQIVSNTSAGLVNYSMPLAIPSAALPGNTFARFRLSTVSSTAGPYDSAGFAADGEVEDYQVTITTSADISITKTDDVDPAFVGGTVNYTVTVTNAGPSDAQGVLIADTFPTGMSLAAAGTSTTHATLTCTPTNAPTCALSGALEAGDSFVLNIPADVGGTATGTLTNSVIAISTTGDPIPDNNAASETTDISGADFGDAPDPASGIATNDYNTTASDNGPSHVVTTTVYLGADIDGDADGQQSSLADGDDTDAAGDDEDGVVFPMTLVDGVSTTTGSVLVTTYGAGTLYGWIDFDKDGDFTDVGEDVIAGVATGVTAASETASYSFTIPAAATFGTTFARFRFCSVAAECDSPTATTTGAVNPSTDGEIEDYEVTLVAAPAAITFSPPDPRLVPGLFTMESDGTNTQFIVGGVVLGSVPTSELSSVTIDGSDGDDELTVDFTNNPIPTGGLTFNGGDNSTGGDNLTLINGTFTNGTFDFDNETDGQILLDASLITYTGLEPITTTLVLTNITFDFNATTATETITLSGDGDGTADDGISFIDSDQGESVSFANNAGVLTINAGSGQHTLNIGELDTDTMGAGVFPSSMVVNADASVDIVNLTPSANYPITADGGTPIAVCPGDVLDLTSGTISSTLPASPITFSSGELDVTHSGFEVFANAAATLAMPAGSVVVSDTLMYPGDNAAFSVTVSNTGTDAAACVVVDISSMFDPPLNVDADDSSILPVSTVPAGTTLDENTLTWVINSLAAGGSETVVIPFVVDTQLSGAFPLDVTATLGNTSVTEDDTLTIDIPFKFPAKAHINTVVFGTTEAGFERMILGMYQGSPGIDGAVWCRTPIPDGDVFTVVGMPVTYKTCSEGTPDTPDGSKQPLYVNDLWLDETGTNAGKIYMTTWGGPGLLVSDNVGETWTAIEPDLGVGGPLSAVAATAWKTIYAITEDATDGILYLSANNGLIFRSLTAGAIWQQVSSLPHGSADTAYSLVSHPATSGHLFAGTMGKGIYESTDFGLSWTPIFDNEALLTATTMPPAGPGTGSVNAGYIFDMEILESPVGSGSYYLFAATSRNVWRQELSAAVPAFSEIDATLVVGIDSQKPEVRALAFGDDLDLDGEPDLYASSWGFGVFRFPTPVAGSLAEQLALRGTNITALAISPSGALFVASEDGEFVELMPASIVSTPIERPTGPDGTETLPIGFALDANYPNPFNPVTTIGFALRETGHATLSVYDGLGREVTVLVDGLIEAGRHEAHFDARDLPSGTYLYRLKTDLGSITRTLVLMK